MLLILMGNSSIFRSTITSLGLNSMFTLLVEEGILFSNDAFGQHICFPQRYDNEIPEYVLMDATKNSTLI